MAGTTIGIDPTKVRTSTEGGEFRLGTLGVVETSAGTKEYVYVTSAAGITGDGYVALVDGSSFDAVMASTTTSAPGTGAGKLAGCARAAIAAGGFGWLQIYGPGTVRAAAAAAIYTIVNTTATAGALDDDATAGSEVIDGIVFDAAPSGAGAFAGFLNYPKVGRTL